VDASLIVAWLIPEQRSPSVADAWELYARGQDQFVGPPTLYAEAISVIRRFAFRNLLTQGEATAMVTDFISYGISVQNPPELYSRAYQLAGRYNQPTVYDTCYLALAQLLSCEFITLDRRLYNAVRKDFPRIRLIVA